jgi:phosphatidylglycerophosphatase A
MKIKLRPGSLPPSLPFTHPASLIATGFGVGLMPMASGTWGSLAALPVGWLVAMHWGTIGLLAATAIATVAGIWASSVVVKAGTAQDPGLIVIDEIAAMWLTLAFTPLTWWGYLVAFLLFRAADIFKPFPANWCDRNVHGGLGVMLDDLVAGLYAGIATYLLSEYLLRDVLASFGF